jgi:hypothetical protein
VSDPRLTDEQAQRVLSSLTDDQAQAFKSAYDAARASVPPDIDHPDWVRVGRYDSAERRALWIYDPDPDARAASAEARLGCTIALRAGREGDDAYVELRRADFPSDEKWLAFERVIACAVYAARDSRKDG